ncbi:right-handed parallel beta-helix repeat-containing protein [Catalinimonas alkaloidigena]|nr:right-handed parallel beta-helix repeat-containing protein [Catalinimonas alkaloidigena]
MNYSIWCYGMVLLSLLAACKKENVEPVAEPLTLECDLVAKGESLTLEDRGAGVDYIASCVVNVRGDLTLAPGVVIQFASDAGLRIYEDGSIQAAGTEEKPIVLTGEDQLPGAWKGVISYSADVKNELRHCTIEYAGGGAFNSNGNEAALILWSGTKLRMSDCTITGSAAYGIDATYSNYDVTIDNTTITQCEMPMYISAPIAGHISGGNFTGNATDAIRVLGSKGGHRLVEDQTWKALSAPYRVSAEGDDLQLGAATLTLEPGVTIEFENGTGIQIGESDASSLVAVGSVIAPITFTGVNKVAGSWGGLEFRFTKSPQNRIQNAVIEYAGSAKWPGAIYMWSNPALSVTNTTFRHIGTCVFYDAPKPNYNPGSQTQNPNLGYDSITTESVGGTYCYGG